MRSKDLLLVAIGCPVLAILSWLRLRAATEGFKGSTRSAPRVLSATEERILIVNVANDPSINYQAVAPESSYRMNGKTLNTNDQVAASKLSFPLTYETRLDLIMTEFDKAEERWWSKFEHNTLDPQEIANRYGISESGNQCTPNATTTVGWIRRRNSSIIEEDQRIPRVIFQTWKTNELSQPICEVATMWNRLNPEYDYLLFDDERIERLISLEFGPRLLEAYRCVKMGAVRSDIWRLLVIYLYGGIYFDLDSKPREPFHTWGFENHTVITGDRCRMPKMKRKFPHGCPHQWGLIYTRRHPIIRDAILETIRNLAARNATHVYNVSLNAYMTYAWPLHHGKYNFMPGWGKEMGGRVEFTNDEVKTEMVGEDKWGHWVKIQGNKGVAGLWSEGCYSGKSPAKPSNNDMDSSNS